MSNRTVTNEALDWHPFLNGVIPVYESDSAQFLAALRGGGFGRLKASTQLSRELLKSVHNLTRVLHRHFVTTGDPPKAPFWSYPVTGFVRPNGRKDQAWL